MGHKMTYRALKSILPCILLTLCIGFCYSFSLFVNPISGCIGHTSEMVRFTFCLNIFFLGMGAATFGSLVENHIRLASLLSSILLFIGLALGGIACSIGSLWLMYLGVGCICGISEGIGYITPNKNMILWFPNTNFKGMLTAISIFTFGLGSALCAKLFGILFPILGMEYTFYAFAVGYGTLMLLSSLLINKPRYALLKLRKQTKSKFSYLDCMKDRFFQKCWLFMFLNISMGLVLIGCCSSILDSLGFSNNVIITIMMLCGIFNGVGRLVFPTIGDFLKNRNRIWLYTAIFEVALMCPIIFAYYSGTFALVAGVCIVLIHAGYGSAFACLPSILSSHFGKDTLSQRHGFCLTSWGLASLMAFMCSTFVLTTFNEYLPMMILVTCGYVLNIIISYSISNNKS